MSGWLAWFRGVLVAAVAILLAACGGGGDDRLGVRELETKLVESSSAILDATCEEEDGGTQFSCRATYLGQVTGVATLQRLPAEISITEADSDEPKVTVLLDGEIADFFVLE